MKGKILLILTLILLSCSKERLLENVRDAEVVIYNEYQLTKSDDDVIIASEIIKAGYLKFVDNAYQISITSEEAYNLGYTKSAYEMLEEQLLVVNELIAEKILQYESDPTISYYVIEDCTYENFEDEQLLVAGFVEMPRGVMEASLGAPATMTFWAPNEMKSLTGHCYANTVLFIAGHFVETHFGGGNIFKSRMGNGYLSIGISASHTSGTIKYTTTDSYGGKFSWEGSTEYAS